MADCVRGLIESAAYRAATRPLLPGSQAASPRAVYHALLPHPAFTPVPEPDDPASLKAQEEAEGDYRRLLSLSILAVLLPAEALRDPYLRILVSDIIGDLLLGTMIGERACDPATIWAGIAKAGQGEKAKGERSGKRRKEKKGASGEKTPAVGASEKEGAGGENRQTAEAEKVQQLSLGPRSVPATATWSSRIGIVLRQAGHAISRGYEATMRVAEALLAASSSSIPTRLKPVDPRPFLEYSIFGLVSQLLELSERMPWTVGALELGRHHLVGGLLRVGGRDGRLDK